MSKTNRNSNPSLQLNTQLVLEVRALVLNVISIICVIIIGQRLVRT